MRSIALVLAVVLAGCASAKVGNVTGEATVNIGAKPPVAVVTTIVKTCQPPAEYMIKHPPLPKIVAARLPLKDEVASHLDDDTAYKLLNIDHSALIDWIHTSCQ